MRHDATKSLYAYWRELLRPGPDGTGPVWPDRSAIEPAAMRRWLGDVFILHEDAGEVRYRLAGTQLSALYGRELAGHAFAAAFEGPDRVTARSWTGTFGQEATPLLFASWGRSRHGEGVALETLLLPLNGGPGSGERRALGITTPRIVPAWAGASPIVEQDLLGVRILRPWQPGLARSDWPVLRPAPNDASTRGDRRLAATGRRVGHLTVLEGGLS